MADRTRTFPVTEPFELDGATYDIGDTVELRREAPKDFFGAFIIRKDGAVIEIKFEAAEMLFRNGALG